MKNMGKWKIEEGWLYKSRKE